MQTRRKYRLALLCAVALAVVLCAGAARADVVYSNLDAGDSFDTTTSFSVDAYQKLATKFTVSGGNRTLGTVEVAVKNTGAPASLLVSLAADASGLPGSIVESIPYTELSSTPNVASVTSVAKPSLEDGVTYWIVVESADASSDAGWYVSTLDPTGGFAYAYSNGAWAVSAGPALAVRVSGDVNPTSIEPTDLGVLPGYANSTARAVNALGQVVGACSNSFDTGRAFLWLPNAAFGMTAGMHDLGVLPGFTDSDAIDINDQGQVIGRWWGGPGMSDRGFLWLPEPAYGLEAGMHLVDGLPGGLAAYPADINEAGQIVGDSLFDVGTGWREPRGFIWQDGVATALTMSASDTTPVAVRGLSAQCLNDNGQVIGIVKEYVNPDDEYPIDRVVLWQGGAATVLTPAGVTCGTEAINAVGQVIGWYNEGREVFLWLPEAADGLESGCHLLATEAGRAVPSQIYVNDINDAGQIIGWSSSGGHWEPDESGDPYGTWVVDPGVLWLWENGAFRDIATTDETFRELRINASGQVAGCSAKAFWDEDWNYLEIKRGYFWSDAAGMLTLETLGGAEIEVNGIGDDGQAIGGSSLEGDTAFHACVWGGAAPTNQPPVADAGIDQSVAVAHDGLDDTNTLSVVLDGSASSDPDGDALTYSWTKNSVEIATGVSPSVNLTPGDHAITLTVTDAQGATDTDEVMISVAPEPNAAPSANAGPDQNPTIRGNTATVKLDGSACGDADGDTLFCTWSENSVVIASGDQPSLNLGIGTHTITLTVMDDYGAFATDDVVVTVSAEKSWLGISGVTAVRKGGAVTVTFTVGNPSTTGADNVNVTAATLGGASTTTRLPVALRSIRAGAGKKCTVKFSGAAVTAGTNTFSVEGTSSLGSFYKTVTVTVP